MRRFAMTVCVLASVVSTAAYAQSATQDITITANVVKTCSINNAATGVPGSATVPVTASGNVNTALITPTGSPFANVACNAPSNIQLSSQNGALTGPAAATGFDNIINYSASATWNSVTATLDTSTVSGSGAGESGTLQGVATANSGPVAVSITPAANSQPLVIGAYSDTLRVSLTPQ